MPSCIVPTPTEIVQVGAQIIPYRKTDLLGMNALLPWKYVDNTTITINRPDIVRGLTGWRGLGSEAPRITGNYDRWGQFCTFWPGYWGEQESIGETELAQNAEPGSCPGMPLNAKNEVSRIQNRLTIRNLYRMEKLIWDTLRTGRYVAHNNLGQIIFQQFFNIRQVSAAIPWTNLSQSTPLRFFRSLPEIFRDTSAVYNGSCTTYYMNQTTLNRMLENSNPLDLGRGSLSSCCNTVTLDWINSQLVAQGLGQIQVYDNRWIDDNGGIHLFIPDGRVIIKGCRPDAKVAGHYYLTKNLNDCLAMQGDSRGFWYFFHDSCGQKITREITVGAGHNGGPILEYPEMIISAKVF